MQDSAILICLALMLVAVGLMQYSSPALRKVGLAGVIAASVVGAYYITGQWWAGVALLILWVLFPLTELVIVVRRLRVPRVRQLQGDAEPPGRFDQLRGLTLDLNDLGFRQVEQCRLRPGLQEQFYRLFVNDETPTHAAIGYVAQLNIGIHFVSFISESDDGRLWMTWNYPLTMVLKAPPGVAIYRDRYAPSAADLYDSHNEFLELNGVAGKLVHVPETPEAVCGRLERALQRQLDYNLSEGILAPARNETGTANLRYSWRGTLFVACEVLRDLVRS